ncbi:MAG: flavodoxin family protein [Nitrososphaerota archaeon]
MRVLGIVCSPRKGGNTEILVNEALLGAAERGAETELIQLAGKNIGPCTACGECANTGNCTIEDDMKPIYQKLLQADGIIVGTPVYFWTVSAQAKLFIDRTYALRGGKLAGKVCGCIAVAGRRGTTNALAQLIMFFLGQGMFPVSNGVSAYASAKGSVKEDQRGMSGARELGRRIAEAIIKR